MVVYTYDQQLLDIKETKNENDITFLITVKSEELRNRLRELRSFLDENKDYTDAMFYTHLDGHYEIIVRNDYYLHFLLQAFRFRCIKTLAWQ